MKTLHYWIPVLFLFIMITACEDDVIVDPLNPAISTSYTGPGTVNPGDTIYVNVNASRGDASLNGLTINENAVAMPNSRILINGSPAVANPILVTGADKESFSWTIGIITPDIEGNYSYGFDIVDENGLTNTSFVSVSTIFPAPILVFFEEPPYFWMDGEVFLGTSFTVKLLAIKGGGEINSLTVLEDDVAIMDTTRVRYENTPFESNPLILSGDAKNGFQWEVSVKVVDAGVHTYAFQIDDDRGESASLTINMSAGTRTDSSKVVLLLNAGGPDKTGGVNLVTGESLNSDDTEAHLIDRGIDLDQPAATNWIKKIAPGNEAELRSAGDLPEGFSFEGVSFKEEILGVHESGTIISESEVVLEGDIFTVSKNNIYFLCRIEKVVETSDDNADYYEIAVKF